jgi:hypothetical protein
MTTRVIEAQRNSTAANAGLASAIALAAGGFLRSVARSPLFVHNDATVAALNVLTAEPLLRLGLAANLVAVAGYAALTLALPYLFRLASTSFFLLAKFFDAIGSAFWAVRTLLHLVPVFLPALAHHLIVF